MSLISDSLQLRLDDLNSTIQEYQKELKILRNVFTEFPDLEFEDLYGRKRYLSKIANSYVNDVDIYVSIGRVMASPFVICQGIRIYSSPTVFYVGNLTDGYWDYDFVENWRNSFINESINVMVINKVEAFERKSKL